MKNSNTRNTLILSALSMLVCVAMLVGTTFAWFTDTASTGVNRIQAGNLKVDLLMYDGTDYESIKNSNFIDLFDFGTGAPGNVWEPGKTKIAYLAVKNVGNLALKYDIILNVQDEGLADALEYAIVDGVDYTRTFTDWTDVKTATTQTGQMPNGLETVVLNGSLLAEGIDYFVLAVHMKEGAGNEYQGKKCNVDVSVFAAQTTYESDESTDSAQFSVSVNA